MTKLSRNVKRQLLKVLILFIIFLVALAAYFVVSFQNTEAELTVYTSMEEPSLPVIYVHTASGDINPMHGYMQDMGQNAASDSVTVLPPDRGLDIRIAEYGNTITKIVYEIRSLDLSHFVERTEISDIESDGSSSYVSLPIQNLIAKDTQYLLRLQVDTGENTINYYTKLIWTDNEYISGMLDFARNFTTRTFDYDAARELTTYIETSDTADNSNLGEVDIHSSFSQLTWGSTDMRLASEPELTIKEYDGIMSAIEVSYMAARETDSQETERYMVKDEFVLRQGSQRIYMMDYQRTADQIFDGSKYLFGGKRINLGINSDGRLQDMSSENGRYIAFKSNRELWCYDQEEHIAVSVFSFRSGTDDGVRADYDKHDIKILSISDEGLTDFVVYGYLNRGVHEGYNGIAYYRYDMSTDAMRELFFMPLGYTFERISLELSELCKKGGNDMLYLKQRDSVIAIDLNSLEMVEIADQLLPGTYAVNSLQTRFAWQDGSDYQTERVRILDIASGVTETIRSSGNNYLRVIGFSNDDVIIGHSGWNDAFSLNGRLKGQPMYQIEIYDTQLNVAKEYSRESIYVDNIELDGSRIKLKLYRKSDDGSGYEYYGEDTIVSTEDPETEPSLILSSEDPVKKRIYYVSLDIEIRTTRTLEVRAPEQISYENSGNIELSGSGLDNDTTIFYAYAGGELILRTPVLSNAIEAGYEDMGYVTDQNRVLVFNRTDRSETVSIQNPMQAAYELIVALEDFTGSHVTEDHEYMILDTYGLSLNQLLYYVYKGVPAAVWLSDSDYCLIYGYNNDRISIYHPAAESEAQRELSLQRAEAEEWLRGLNYNSICAVEY